MELAAGIFIEETWCESVSDLRRSVTSGSSRGACSRTAPSRRYRSSVLQCSTRGGEAVGCHDDFYLN